MNLGLVALGNARSVVPREGVSEPKDPKEDMIDEDEDRDERDSHLVVARRENSYLKRGGQTDSQAVSVSGLNGLDWVIEITTAVARGE